MLRKIIEIDKATCNGCGICVDACHEGAIGMVDGIATLLRDDYCDGLGDCLPTCPTGAISFIEREALAYDEASVRKHMETKKQQEPLPCGCPSTHAQQFQRSPSEQALSSIPSALQQWPVQIKLAPIQAPYFKNSNLLIAADCTAYAYGDFHNRFMKNRITFIGCPKLDQIEYAEKLTEIIRNNDIQSVCVVRMEVPCCGGIEHAVKTALQTSGKFIPWSVVTISTDGSILDSSMV